MQRGEIGRYEVTSVGGERVRAFVPLPLPPAPALVLDGSLQQALESAVLALGRLDAVSTLLPDNALFLYSYVRKEAVLSSQIEGTQSSLSDLLLFEIEEAPGIPIDDVSEVSRYVAALEHGLLRLRQNFPLSNRLIREIHGVLLSSGRGQTQTPGRVPPLAELDRRQPAGPCCFRAAAAPGRARLHDGVGALPPCLQRRAARTAEGGACSRAVRNHSPLS